MADQRKMTTGDRILGIVVLLVTIVVVYLLAGALSIPAPLWLLAAIGAGVGIVIWYAILNRRKS